MDRNVAANRHSKRWLLSLGILLSAAGCAGPLTTAMYLINGTDIKAEFKDLKGKRVAVVCRAPATDQFQNDQAAEMLAQEVSRLLEQNVANVDVVDYADAAAWQDENTWDDPTELAEGVDADMVVAIDLNSFDIYQGQTLYQGNARVSLAVHDMEQDGEVVFEKVLPPSIYPPNVGVPTSERPDDSVFRAEYIQVLGDEVGRHFYNHDSYADVARDSTAFGL